MSNVEAYIGKLIPVDMDGRSIEEVSRDLCKAEKLPNYIKFWLEQLMEEQWENYHYNKELNQLFRVEKKKINPESFELVTKNDDGTYDFIASYYNGGTYLDEVLTSGIKKAKNS